MKTLNVQYQLIDYSIPVYSSLEQSLKAGFFDRRELLLPAKQMFMTSGNWQKIKAGHKRQTRRPSFRDFFNGVYWIREIATYIEIKSDRENSYTCVQYGDRTFSGFIKLPPNFNKSNIKLGHKTPRGIPKCFARSFLSVLASRKERLQDISREDAIAEGISPDSKDPIGDFIDLWDSIYEKKPGCNWKDNPVVSVLDIAYLNG